MPFSKQRKRRRFCQCLQEALTVITAVEFSGEELLNCGATETGQADSPEQVSLSFSVHFSKKFTNLAVALGISNLGTQKFILTPLVFFEMQKNPIPSFWYIYSDPSTVPLFSIKDLHFESYRNYYFD